MGLFDNASIVAINNKLVQSIVTSDGGVLYEKTDMASLSIDVPLNLVYSDAFSITGALTDVHGDGISGETVDLYVGDTLVDSTTTDSNGEYEFTQTPVSAGTHSFQVKYAGNTSYSSTTSSKVYRMVGKETTLLSVTSPVDNSTYYVGGAIGVNGTLLTDDGEPLGNKHINYKLDGSTITSINTSNDGSISFQLGTINTGSHTIELSYAGDSNYTGSSVTRHITVLDHNYAISISCSTPVIESGDSASIVATLTDNGVAVSGQVLPFQIKHDNTVLDSGSRTTDSNGQITFSYTGTGIGDVSFILGYGTSLQETFAITDYYIYDDGTSDKSNMYNATNTSLTFDTDHYIAVSSTTSSASNYIALIEPTNMPTLSNFSIECDIKLISGTGQGGLNYIDGITTVSASQKAVELISAYNNNIKGLVIRNPNFNGGNRVNGALSTNTWYTFKLQFNGTSITAIISQNGSDVYSRTVTDSVVSSLAHICIYQADASNTIHFKNLKIKAL